ncbi:MAG: acyl-CoA dehydrogenase family protein, partial [Phenylobacterium sp.]
MTAHVPSPAAASSLPFLPEHEMFRTTARRFLETECVPHRDEWDEAGMAPRSAWKRAGELGLLCFRQPEAYGGQGADILFSVALMEEQVRAGVVGPMLSLHNDVVAPYVELYGDEDQKARVLPRMAAGDWIGAIAMTEPGGGSDLRGMTTRAIRDGDDYVISGRKTFISNGACADLIVLAAQTEAGISLFLVETPGLAGFAHGEPLEKLGQWSADTTELFFDEARIPATALLGGVEGRGFAQLMARLVEERLMTAVGAVATMETALAHTLDYTAERKAFGQRVIDFQNSRFRLAECQTETVVCRTYLERCLLKFIAGRLTPEEAAMLKLATTEKQNQVVDACLQLHGGYGYMTEYPVARAWADARVTRIYGGTTEIMKEIV